MSRERSWRTFSASCYSEFLKYTNQYTIATRIVPPRTLPSVTSARLLTAPATESGAEVPVASATPIGRKYMLATECSNPQATNAVIGKTVARILSVTLRAPMHNQTARQTSTLQRIPRTTAETGSRAILLRAIWTIVSPTKPLLIVCTPASHTKIAVPTAPTRLPRYTQPQSVSYTHLRAHE